MQSSKQVVVLFSESALAHVPLAELLLWLRWMRVQSECLRTALSDLPTSLAL
jgi:hypothetical protein